MGKPFQNRELLPGVIVNPGTEPLLDSDPKLAEANMHTLIADTGLDATFKREPSLDYDSKYQDGRYAFTVELDGQGAEVQMPGVPLADVRYKGREFGQNIWDFPRLYVEGSSWVWTFAVGSLHRALTGDKDWDWKPEADS